ncbi:MAG: nucleoside triphosphate pyrophosphohydrolase [Rhodothermales bacterium]
MQEKIYEAKFKPSQEIIDAFIDFYAIVGQLRRDCPWDKEQTHESVKQLLIEESYEAVDAIDNKDWQELSKELGDVLLHVLFHSDIGAASNSFTLLEVLQQETEKLVRRHPHVFGDTQVNSVEEVHKNWERIKKEEGKRSALEGIPRHLPALQRAYRIQSRAASVGFDFENTEDTWAKVEEELQEFKELAEQHGSSTEKEKEFGDILFALVNYGRFHDLQPENALRTTNAKFVRRFTHIEESLEAQGKRWEDVDLAEMDRYWNEAKAME